jgi:poly-gamma-glutamate capsule biosynthesis protein CapA/YwtB (metallophosphatase superfamily)
MADLPLADPTLAKQVWDSMPNASTRRVARKLRQAGASISHMTVARWRNQGWRPLDGEQQHPLELALASLDDTVPVLTAHPLTTAAGIVQAIAEGEALEKLTDDELLRKTAREVAIAVYVVAHAMIYKAEVMATKPAEAGFLAQALAKCFAAATAAFGQLRNSASS